MKNNEKFTGSWSVTNAVPTTESEVGLETLMERMKTLSQKSEECSQEEAAKRFENVETQSIELSSNLELQNPNLNADIGHFVEDPTFLYQDFAKRGDHDIPTFRVQVCN